jgi:SAM-dependent methyltransferase
MPSSSGTHRSIPGEPWSRYAREWDLIGSPLRPVAEDVQATLGEVQAHHAEHANRPLRALLLGVTPELATMAWPPGTSLVAVDRSEPMLAAVFPKEGLPEHARAVCADWRALPLADDSIDVTLGDGCFTIFAFPDGLRLFAEEVRRVMARGGRFLIRVFAAPEAREDLAAIREDLRAGKIGSFHSLKWRLAMALQSSPERGVALADVYAAYADLRPLLSQMSSRPGFEPEVTGTIEAYRGSTGTYWFPTVPRICEALAGLFALSATFTKTYELGERCPTLVLRAI